MHYLQGYASKPYKESINIEERYLVYNDLELLEKVKDFKMRVMIMDALIYFIWDIFKC